MLRQLRGVVCFSITTDSPETFINEVRNSKAACFDISVKGCVVYARTYGRDLGKIRIIAAKCGLTLDVISKRGFVFKAIRYKKRYGILAGAILAIAVIFYCSNTVMKIEIAGNYLVSDEKILAVLESNGVKFGSFIPDINTGNLRRRVMLAFDELAWVGVRASDGRVVVEVTEAVDKPEMVPINQKCNIVASRDGFIVGVKIFSGRGTVKVGDGVTEGTMLISGVITDKHGKSVVVRADGEIIARYEEKVKFTQTLESSERAVKSEREEKHLYLFGKVIGSDNSLEGDAELERATSCISFLGITLPVGITYDTYRVYETIDVRHTPISAEESVKRQMEDYERIFLSDAVIVSREIIREDMPDSVCITVNYTLESDISESKNIVM